MADTISEARRSWNMGQIRAKGMKPELVLRKLVYGMGYRYRLHRKDLPGKPDLVFAARKKIIFMHGCFWHSHADPTCKISRIPKSKQEYWIPKLQKNRERDESHLVELTALGWDVFVVWECRLKDEAEIGEQIYRFLEGCPTQHQKSPYKGL
jgi:DNA mismatch endonuclease, patch repair protein